MTKKSLFSNYLTSGHHFSEDEYEMKSKLVLLNSMLWFTLLVVSVLAILLFTRGEYFFAYANCIYIIIGMSGIYFLRKNKYNHRYIIPFFPLISIALIVVALITYPTEHVRFSWFLVVIIVAFFLGGRKLGFISTILSIISIIVIDMIYDTHLSTYALILTISILTLGSLAISLYERREFDLKKKLNDINHALEEKIKDESKKRIKVYQESNLELQESAKKLNIQKDAYKYLAHYDTLTKLPNRIFFLDRLEHSIDKAKRNNKTQCFLRLMLDLVFLL